MHSKLNGVNFGGVFDLEALSARIQEMEAVMAQSDFWSDTEAANKHIATLKSIKIRTEPVGVFEAAIKDLTELFDMTEENDAETIGMLTEELASLEKQFDALEIKSLLSGELDKEDAILSIHAGAGGTESCDWAQMLLRMIRRWAEDQDYKVQLIDLLPGEEAGVKNATLLIQGPYAYGYLQSEQGVHRLVRISPFDSNKRRHTSFVSMDVIPDTDEDVDIEIEESDLRIDVYRSSGKGGQSVNTTDSAVRITHIPTNTVVQCQDERSQLQNKAKAMHVLKSRLAEVERQKREESLQQTYESKQKIEWGSQIRSYVLHPYNMVKDHRTSEETGNTQAVLDGRLDSFMGAYLKWKAKKN